MPALPASSGKEALDILRRDEPVDLVITDHAMPQMTGLQLADAIKKQWPDLPVVLATGFAELQPGHGSALPKLAKPFTEAELAEAIANIVPRTGRRVVKFPSSASSKT